ncbi:hypothetical protein OHB07_01430 [Streptomyces sp. NBC_00111]|uniref:hypothetical protein n=1 Tax=unclassified Streptomyces TaxID=2593676 RepID=UPI002E35BDD5|nr:hypothetical protein [Streptomyces sp. NBC_01460]
MGLILLVLLIGLLWLLLALLPLRRRTVRLVFTSVHLAATVVLVVAADRSSPGQPALWVLLFGPGGLVSLVRLGRATVSA